MDTHIDPLRAAGVCRPQMRCRRPGRSIAANAPAPCIALLLSLLIAWLAAPPAAAQCPPSKHGIVPVWPQTWTPAEREAWFVDMSERGMGYMHVVYTWPEYEQLQDSGGVAAAVAYLDHLRHDLGYRIHLLIRNPNFSTNPVPPRFAGLDFSDPELSDAFHDFVFEFLADFAPVIDQFTVGGEADGYFARNPEEMPYFVDLLADIATHVHGTYPGIDFSTVVTFEHGILTDDSLWQATRAFSDMLTITYWPLHADFTVIPTAIEDLDLKLDLLRLAAGDKPILIKEAGLPTDPLLGGSPALQAGFVERLTRLTTADPRIIGVGWDFLADFDAEAVQYWVDLQQIDTPEFRAYMGSLGLVDTLGYAKPGYSAYLELLEEICEFTAVDDPTPGAAARLDVAPNPTAGRLMVSRRPALVDVVEFAVYSLDGKRVLDITSAASSVTIDTSSLASGVYLIRARDRHGGVATRRFVKLR